ncbi:AbiV family abortive infection protein [Roseiarcaceae bacterium H3SJ34-1]|uniref:AbiV family abortive infection protein n=1 Tax=Terripilifer ovatus TaxID=3032367 RepID=UPI003AB97012|nr:AbiV family abortive infection protein [Roseiarcaceae bacterium H3SJ34-1]
MNQSIPVHEPTPAILAIIANCKRLIADSALLLEQGSHGSSIALAILAFEEAGKGLREELDLAKTKRTPSWHQFRQIIAGFMLQLAVLQKYGIKPVQLPEQIQAELRARHEGTKTLSEVFNRPLSDELRQAVAKASRPAIQHLSGDQAAIAQLELHYIRTILESACKGEVEQARQRGMYVDVSNGVVTSDPAEIGLHEIHRWLFVARRALLLLEAGDFMAPFSPLAARLEGKFGVRPDTHKNASDFFDDILRRVRSGEEFIDVYFSTLPESEQNEFKDQLPKLKSLFNAQWRDLIVPQQKTV